MSIPSPFQPDHNAPWRILRRTDRDAVALIDHQPTGPVERESPGSAEHAYLDGLIVKPWGRELRMYIDGRTDAWCLEIAPGSGTSLHAHTTKRTYLIGLGGAGVLATMDGEQIPIQPGDVIQIEPGVLHQTTTDHGLAMLEVERPPNKLDLVRLGDRYGRAGMGYETQSARREPAPLASIFGGPPSARLRRLCASGRFRFDIETGAALQRSPEDIVVAISLDVGSVARVEPSIVGVGALYTAHPGRPYLTVRSDR